MTQRAWKRCAPQATARPWLPSVAQVTVMRSVAARYLPASRSAWSPPERPRCGQVHCNSSGDGIGAAERLEDAKAESASFIFQAKHADPGLRAISGRSRNGVGA